MSRRTLPRFSSLSSAYPTENAPCDGPWAHQCSIRLSIALTGAGFHLTEYSDPVCKHGHARGAESLANYLWKQVGAPRKWDDAGKAEAGTKAKSGIVFFRNIAGFRGGRGDHIDLWDGTATKTGAYFTAAAETWFWKVD